MHTIIDQFKIITTKQTLEKFTEFLNQSCSLNEHQLNISCVVYPTSYIFE